MSSATDTTARAIITASAAINGERLVSLFENFELGLKPKTVYELVPEFFRSFES